MKYLTIMGAFETQKGRGKLWWENWMTKLNFSLDSCPHSVVHNHMNRYFSLNKSRESLSPRSIRKCITNYATTNYELLDVELMSMLNEFRVLRFGFAPRGAWYPVFEWHWSDTGYFSPSAFVVFDWNDYNAAGPRSDVSIFGTHFYFRH